MQQLLSLEMWTQMKYYILIVLKMPVDILMKKIISHFADDMREK